MAVKTEARISSAEADREIYIDFEGCQDRSPSLLGTLIEDTLHQTVLDPELSSAAAAKDLPVSSLADEVHRLVEISTKERRPIIAYTHFEKNVILEYSQVDLTGFYRDARMIARRWKKNADLPLISTEALKKYRVPNVLTWSNLSYSSCFVRHGKIRRKNSQQIRKAEWRNFRRGDFTARNIKIDDRRRRDCSNTKKNRPCSRAPSYLSGLLLLPLLSSCSIIPMRSHAVTRDRAFISYSLPENGTQLRLAVKDLIDMKGQVTSAGSEYLSKNNPPATEDAECLALARARGVQIVGKTNLTEFAVTVSGTNRYFGTPVNRLDGKHKFIPGGSSSGSAVAVADGMADIAFGTDTGGSIRIPAACCGVLGLKTTYGLVSTKGVFPISPKHLDTVGPMARDIPHLVQGMDLLQGGFAARYRNAVAAEPSARGIRIGRLYLDGTDPAIDKAIDDKLAAKGFGVIRLSQTLKAKWKQAEKDGRTVAVGDAWLHDHQYSDKDGVSATTKLVIADGAVEYPDNFKAALKRQAAWQRELRRVFRSVDFIALPTMQSLPPKFPPFDASVAFELLVFNLQNTLAVNFAGNPALAIPVPMPVKEDSLPMVTSLQLIGPRLSEPQLLNAGRLLEAKR